MAGIKTQQNGKPAQPMNPIYGVASSISDVASDLLELAEMQIKLGRHDIKSACRHAVLPFVLLTIGACSLIAGMPVIALGAAQLLAEAWNLPPGHSQLLVGCVIAVVAVASISIAFVGLRSAMNKMHRSSAELAKNLAWLKGILRGDL